MPSSVLINYLWCYNYSEYGSLFGPDPLPSISGWKLSFSTSMLQHFTAESSRELRRNAPWGNKQKQVSTFLIFLFKLLSPFLSISILSLLPFSILSLLPLHHPFFLFWSILCPPKIQTSIYYILFTNGTYFCILFHTMTFFFNNAFYNLKQTKFLCLSSNLSYPEDLKKQWLPFSILSLLPFLISPSLSSIPSCSSDQFSVLLR